MSLAMLAPTTDQPPPPPPIDFQSFSDVGDIVWRLRLAGTSIIVNCREYSRWHSIWGQTAHLFAEVASILDDRQRAIESLMLEYTDVFVHIGDPDTYELETLIQTSSPHIPRTVLNHGPLWHSHQGWFTNMGVPEGTRLLRRMHISGIQSSPNTYAVKMEMLTRLDFLKTTERPLLSASSISERVQGSFELLHERSKEILSEYLTEQMIERISLNAP